MNPLAPSGLRLSVNIVHFIISGLSFCFHDNRNCFIPIWHNTLIRSFFWIDDQLDEIGVNAEFGKNRTLRKYCLK